jgi:hypothetical protein
MDTQNFDPHDLTSAAEAVGKLAEDDALFRSTIAAYRMLDRVTFGDVLSKLELLPRCEWICHWIWGKECVRICFDLCGPPPLDIPELEIDRFAEIVSRITADDSSVKRLAYAVDQQDREEFDRLVKEFEIGPYCHLLCHWVCAIRGRYVCEVLCGPALIERQMLADQLQTAGLAVRELVERGALAEAAKAVEASDCRGLQSVLTSVELTGRCVWICEFFCTWRCVPVCLRLCAPFLADAISPTIDEMQAFGRQVGRLATIEGVLDRFHAAVEAQDAEAFGALVKEYELQRYCVQLCHWLCSWICRGYCFCVCPPVSLIPLFTHVGTYHVDPSFNDFTTDGTTTAGEFAFTDTIPLIGLVPPPTDPLAIEYRFLYAEYPGLSPEQIVDATMIAPTVIGQLEYLAWNSILGMWVPRSTEYWANKPSEPLLSIPQQFGTPLLVSVNKNVNAQGWIEVPRENDLTPTGVGRFVPLGGLANLDTTKLANQAFNLTIAAPPLPLKAGDGVPPAQQAAKPTFKLKFEAREVGTSPLVPPYHNDLEKIAISNTHYTFIRHPAWAGGMVTARAVVSLDIAELIPPVGTGCNDLSSHVHALFTAYHPYLGQVSVYLEGPGPLPPSIAFPPPPHPADGAHSAPGGSDFDISALPPCAYIMWLAATLKLTSGYGQIGDATIYDHIAFCKGEE